jgi:sulfate adenylyltransferase subunit 1 (EFTu-like GTPase family)
MPSGKTSRVERIVTMDGDLEVAVAGQSVTLTLADEIDASRGDILVAADRKAEIATEIRARLLWTAETDMHPGASYIVKIGARMSNASIAKIHHLVDIHTFEPTPAHSLGLNEIGLATIRFDRQMIVSDYRGNRDLGGFILIDRITNETVAFGLIDLQAAGAGDQPEQPAPPEPWWPQVRQTAQSKLVPGMFSGVSVGLGAILLGASPATGLLLGLGDAALRPLARSFYTDYRRNASRRAAAKRAAEREEALSDGDGI